MQKKIMVLAVFASLLTVHSAHAQSALNAGAKTGASVKSAKPEEVNSIVVVVNDEVITRLELNERLRSVERRLASQGTALPNRVDLQKQMLERMIVDKVQLQLAKENGLRVDDVMLDRSMQRLAEQNKMSLQEFRNQVEREGTSFARFREEIRDDIIMQRIREREVDSKLQISEQEVDNFLAAEQASAENQQELNLAQILVRIPENATNAQLAQRLARAQEVLAKLKAGEDFAKLSATYSDAPEALKGGDVGWREQDRLPALFVDAINKVTVGGISEIVKSPNGYHIVKLLGKRPLAGKNAAAAVQQSRVRHILLKVSQVQTSQDAKRKLLEYKERIDKKTATFDELAKTFSNDLSASKGGELGWIFPGDTVPEFEQAMAKLALNEVSAPIETPYGVHLIEVLERKSDDASAKERKRVAARLALRERKSEESMQDWVRQLRDRAYVEFRLEDK